MRTQLLGVKDMDDAISLFAALGYDRPTAPWDLGMAPIPGADRVRTAQSGRRRRQGYAVVFAETSKAPRSLRPFARAVRDHVHDRPLAVLGITGDNGTEWERMIVIRPRTTQTGGAVTVTKLDIDLRHPTQHDAEVLNQVEWQPGDDRAAQRHVDEAFNVEAVTNRFFRGLADHYQRIVASVQAAMDADPAVADRLKPLGSEPASRGALRILTQVLFTQFLQKKGFVEGRQDWLNHAYRTKTGPYYQTVLERLFYSGLGTPRDKRKPGDPEVPYLNGGLFERFYGNISLPLPDELFDTADGLLGYLSRWTFTVHEDAPDESEVAVDPEMLGKIFEHLSGEESVQERGTVYTPRPVVHFMCREALVPWMQHQLSIDERTARFILTHENPFHSQELHEQIGSDRLHRLIADLDAALDDLHVLDPAVGSGAFPLGMLSEIIRLRTLRHKALNQDWDPGADQVTAWKNHAIRSSLYGIDIEPRAIELCRLRYWLSLLVDLPAGAEPQPLPNLEYRTVVADSLTDFVNGVEIQNTRDDGGLDFFSEPELEELHDRWYNAFGDEREELATRIREIEERVVRRQLDEAIVHAPTDAARKQAEELLIRFLSRNREFPCFVPALLAPDVTARGGWDIVIMNPPYVSRKEVARRLPRQKVSDYKRHHGDTADLMILFAKRAIELVRKGGVVSMIFNDSITTSTDGDDIRRSWVNQYRPLVMARTKCFEGRAVYGGIVVVQIAAADDSTRTRWVEGFGKPVADFTEASNPEVATASAFSEAGQLENWPMTLGNLRVLPNRPLFRPSSPAIQTLRLYERCTGWSDSGGWGTWDPRGKTGWRQLSNTRSLEAYKQRLWDSGFYDRLQPGDWTLLGLCIQGGQGLATADDRRFIAAIEDTPDADDHIRNQERFESLTLANDIAARLYRHHLHKGREAALLEVWEELFGDAGWPRTGTFRIARRNELRTKPLSEDERQHGIASGPHFVPYEKGDSSGSQEGRAIGAKWTRSNGLVIDWSQEAVKLLRDRAAAGGSRSPRLQHEDSWFSKGVTWNRVASYLRVRQVPETAIFSSEAPTVKPTVPWLPAEALLALLNSPVLEFMLRTFLGSRMHIEIGDVRKLPVPVLHEGSATALTGLARQAVENTAAGDESALVEAETEIDHLVRDLYGVAHDAHLWVVR